MTFFVKMFPEQKQQMEESFKMLYAMADKIDGTHQNYTIMSLTFKGISLVASILGISGINEESTCNLFLATLQIRIRLLHVPL